MRDTYTHTERDAGRWEAQHAERTREYEPEPHEPRRLPSDDPIALKVKEAYVEANLLHGCSRCAGQFWNRGDRDSHEEGCGA